MRIDRADVELLIASTLWALVVVGAWFGSIVWILSGLAMGTNY